MQPKFSDVEFANLIKRIPIGYYLVVPIKGQPYFKSKGNING